MNNSGDNHAGYDVLSVDHHSERKRYIEVKGVTGIFSEDASIILTNRQGRDAIKNDDPNVEYWLYVVDSIETDSPGVFPIPWTRGRIGFGFYARAWRDAAENSEKPETE